jgi:putative glutamine amidotransferase
MDAIRRLGSKLRHYADNAVSSMRGESKLPPFNPQLDRVVRGHEERLRSTLSAGHGKCIVGMPVCDDQAAVGDDWNVAPLLAAGAEIRFLSPSRGSLSHQLKGVNALMIPGGADVHPSLYGEKVNGAFPDDINFDKFQIDLIKRGYDKGIPMLGVCRGQQIMNVAAGGSLIQDLPSQWQGQPDDGRPIRHAGYNHMLYADPASIMGGILGKRYVVNSLHHEAVGLVGDKMQVVACAPDGVIEGLQREDHPFQISVQFHPEILTEDPKMQKFFDLLVEHGQKYPLKWYQHRPHVPKLAPWQTGQQAVEIAKQSVAFQRTHDYQPPQAPRFSAPPPLQPAPNTSPASCTSPNTAAT